VLPADDLGGHAPRTIVAQREKTCKRGSKDIVLSGRTPDRGRLHGLSTGATRNREKTARNPLRGGQFKPIQAKLRLTTKAACDYTKRPEVKAAPPVAARAPELGDLAGRTETQGSRLHADP
jgi:hypothetical protein